jgi:hypothetical protein
MTLAGCFFERRNFLGMNDMMKDLVQHTVQGVLWEKNRQITLVLGNDEAQPDGNLSAEGDLIIRYGIPLHQTSYLSVIPAWFVADRGGQMRGWQAWQWIMKLHPTHPRAEIFGLRSDGQSTQVFLRELDFYVPIRIYAYLQPDEMIPKARITHLIYEQGAQVPDLLLKTLVPQK